MSVAMYMEHRRHAESSHSHLRIAAHVGEIQNGFLRQMNVLASRLLLIAMWSLLVVGCRSDTSERVKSMHESSLVESAEGKNMRSNDPDIYSRWQGRMLENGIPAFDMQDVGNPFINRCSELDVGLFDEGKACGSPLSMPCFDHSRCQLGRDGTPPKVYIYDNNCSLTPSYEMEMTDTVEDVNLLNPVLRGAANELGILAETYESACIFIDINVFVNHYSCAPSAPLWNNGMNHFIIDFSDWTRDKRRAIANSYAMEGSSNMRTCYYRSGYDISVPLSPRRNFKYLGSVPPNERKYFLTFKGTLYLGGAGSEERLAAVPIHNDAEGVIVSMHCLESHGEHLIPKNVEFCEKLKENNQHYDYEDVMNTTFGLVLAGRSPGTYRLAEIMGAGAIPVIVARDYVRPFSEEVNWPSFSFMFSPNEVRTEMLDILKAVPPETLKRMQMKSLEAYNTMFGESNGHPDVFRRILRMLMDRVNGN